jgi:hypothetical protein
LPLKFNVKKYWNYCVDPYKALPIVLKDGWKYDSPTHRSKQSHYFENLDHWLSEPRFHLRIPRAFKQDIETIFSNGPPCWMPCHIWSRQMSSLLCGSFHVSSNRVNVFSHMEQANGFSPVWILSCLFKPCKCFLTYGTGKWLLSCVDPFIYLQTV